MVALRCGSAHGGHETIADLGGANLAATGILYASEKLIAGDAARRDDFRELALFSAKVERTRILHKLWCMLDGMVRRERSSGILVMEQDGRLMLSESSKSSARFELLCAASDRPVAPAVFPNFVLSRPERC